MTQWTLARIRQVVREVTAYVAIGSDIEPKKLTVTMNVPADYKTEQAARQALIDAGEQDIEFANLNQNVVALIEGGPIDDVGVPYTQEEMLNIGPIRTAIAKEFELVMQGLRRKN